VEQRLALRPVKLPRLPLEEVLNLRERAVGVDAAPTAVVLASDDAAMMAGVNLSVDAGALARYWRWDPAVPPA